MSQAVVCYRAARWQWLCDSGITKQCVVTWPATERVFKEAKEWDGDIKRRQMGWNNGIIELVCDKLHQVIMETPTGRRSEEISQKHQMLPNCNALLFKMTIIVPLTASAAFFYYYFFFISLLDATLAAVSVLPAIVLYQVKDVTFFGDASGSVVICDLLGN